MVLYATLQVNSNIVSGLAKLAWQTLPTFAIYKLAETIIAASNLHQIYDRRTTLKPRNSLLFTLTNVPVGHPPIVLLLSLVLLLHIVLSVLLDFSINGETRKIYAPVAFRTVVAAHPDQVPLDIDYAAEFRASDAPPSQTRFPRGVDTDKRLVSARLVAVKQIDACRFLDSEFRTAYAQAYRDAALGTQLVTAESLPPRGACVRTDEFEHALVSSRYKLSGFPKAECEIQRMAVDYEPSGGNVIGIGKPTLGDVCDLKFDEVRCFGLGTDHCGAIARRSDGVAYVFYMPDANDTKKFELHELRFARMASAELRARFAANVAFLQAVGMTDGSWAAMFGAIAQVRYNETLRVRAAEREREVTVINVAVLAAVAAVEGLVLGALCAVAAWMWHAWVVKKKRQQYISFSSLLDVFAMVTANGFVKKHEKGHMTRLVGLVADEPGVFVDEKHMNRSGGLTKRISDSGELSIA